MRIRRKHVFKFFVCLSLLTLLFCNRYVILRGFGTFLIRVDEPQKTEAIFVLSGNAVDRGARAAELFKEGVSPLLICLGGEKSDVLEAWGIQVKTCEVTQKAILLKGVDSAHIELLCEGTSTFEEFEAILRYCKSHHMTKIGVVSSLFHTRRINNFFRKKLANAGIQLCLFGASESSFDEAEWWKKEEGMIFLNNEYIKMGYYFLNH